MIGNQFTCCSNVFSSVAISNSRCMSCYFSFIINLVEPVVSFASLILNPLQFTPDQQTCNFSEVLDRVYVLPWDVT